MTRKFSLIAAATFVLPLMGAAAFAQAPVRAPLDERIAHGDPARCIAGKSGCLKKTIRPGPHAGALQINWGSFFDAPNGRPNDTAKFNLGSPLRFLRRGELPAGASFGQHFHNTTEEMFIILEGEADFTIDGRTSRLKGPVGAPVRLGHSHGIYNASGKTAQMMNISIGMGPGGIEAGSGAYDLNDNRVNAVLDPIPQFMRMNLDPALLRPVENMDGGKGRAMHARALEPSVFSSPWSYVDHLVLPPGASIGPVSRPGMSEIYVVLSGEGTATISGETAKIYKDDAVPAAIDESRAFANTGTAPLDFMVIGIARDLAAKAAYVRAQAGQGRGRGAD